ncbi:hypothetical protein AB0952_24095 [Streptomyces caniferus]|uniref:hypothetical protein n=1 Tax=Streptomyces caniferus TaxID=285557 RepID=UPI0034544798
MSSAAIPPGSAHPVSLHPVKGATALGSDPGSGPAPVHEHRYVVGNALRAIKVFATAAFSVVVMGEYADDSTDGSTDDSTDRPTHLTSA